jgi:DNA-binding GntR family transcriptional regulator
MKASPLVAPIVHEGLGDRVYKTVRDLILGQAFPPGSKLNIEQLGRELRVSRTPVWEAMRRLESEGLLETVPRQGVFVLNFSMERVMDLFAVRGALEGLAARLAASALAPEDRTALEQSLGELEGAFRTRDIERYSGGAIELHDRVLAAARNQVLSRQLQNVYAQIHLLRLRSLHLPERLDTSLDEHRRIVRAVIASDADEAEAVSRRHAERVLEDALAVLQKAAS